MLNTVLFDLDGTLLPLDHDKFLKVYFGNLSKRFMKLGYNPEEVIKKLWMGTTAMIKNNGEVTNEVRFFETFNGLVDSNHEVIKEEIFQFYSSEYDLTKEVTYMNPLAKKCVSMLKEKGYTVILATNPVFPQVATHKRISWAGLEPTDFDLVTTFENSYYCKPNLKYYESILNQINKEPSECIMIGNDIKEDMCARELNIDTFLLNDCLLNVDNHDISHYKQGNFNDLFQFIESLPSIK